MTQLARARDPAEAREERVANRLVAGCFLLSTLGTISFATAYAVGNNAQWGGASLALALIAMGLGLSIWADRLVKARPVVEERHQTGSGPGEVEALERTFMAELSPGVTRRRMLLGLLAAAGGALGLALLFPLRSMYPGGASPGAVMKRTAWTPGARLVTEDNLPVKADSLQLDGILTVYPENHLDMENADDAMSIAMLIHAPVNMLVPPTDIAGAPNGLICFSKLCTHAGCPVGLYQVTSHSLFCPCHQSQFSILDGGQPFFGPASARLPQLPLAIDPEGYLVATGPFNGAVGPPYWEQYK